MRIRERLSRIRQSFSPQRIKGFYGRVVFTFKFRYRPRVLARYHGRSLEHVAGPASTPGRKRVVAVVPYYGNSAILPRFLAHHRSLGVEFFVFLDLSLTHPLLPVLPDLPDGAIWKPRGTASLAPALHWLNFLRRHYATGRWCLSIEPSDLLVFPRYETRHIRDLIEILDNEGRNHMYAVVVEAYGDKPAIEIDHDADPAAALPFFDGIGYVSEHARRFRSVITRGGVQRRTLFQAEPKRAPALDRVPLVKWKKGFTYVAGTRVLTPRNLNTAHSQWHCSPTGCLMRYALLDDGDSLAIAAKVEGSTLLRDRMASTYPGLFALREQQLKSPVSVRYTGSGDLVAWGLMTPGQWF